MKIGLISDSHDHMGTLKAALRILSSEGVQTLIHCGDMTSPQTAALLTGFKVIYVVGNMDPSLPAIRQVLKDLNTENYTGPNFTGVLAGMRLAATHGHRTGEIDKWIRSGRYQYVFHGHTHRRRDEAIGKTRVINPGALGGIRYEPRTLCVLDLLEGEAHSIKVANY